MVGEGACPPFDRSTYGLITLDAAIAQPVEHLIRNEGVGGSSPSCGTSINLSR